MVSAAVFCFICQLFRRISNAFVIGSCGFDANDGIEIDGSNPATSFWWDFGFCFVWLFGNMVLRFVSIQKSMCY